MTNDLETKHYVEVKRFLESLVGDPETRQLSRASEGKKRKKLKELGLDFSPADVDFIWYHYREYDQQLDRQAWQNDDNIIRQLYGL